MHLDRKNQREQREALRQDGEARTELEAEQLENAAGGFRRNNLGLFTLNIGTVENV